MRWQQRGRDVVRLACAGSVAQRVSLPNPTCVMVVTCPVAIKHCLARFIIATCCLTMGIWIALLVGPNLAATAILLEKGKVVRMPLLPAESCCTRSVPLLASLSVRRVARQPLLIQTYSRLTQAYPIIMVLFQNKALLTELRTVPCQTPCGHSDNESVTSIWFTDQQGGAPKSTKRLNTMALRWNPRRNKNKRHEMVCNCRHKPHCYRN